MTALKNVIFRQTVGPGKQHRLPIEWTPLTIYKRTADVNLWGLIEMTKTFLPLVKRARGRVVNFSSGAGKGKMSKPD